MTYGQKGSNCNVEILLQLDLLSNRIVYSTPMLHEEGVYVLDAQAGASEIRVGVSCSGVCSRHMEI